MTDNDELLRTYSIIARREQRERIAKGLRVVKAAKKAGLPVKAATVEGVALEFGAPETNETISANPWDEIYGAPQQQRPS
jgi:hypothetical protein